jgi:hypothetical protein
MLAESSFGGGLDIECLYVLKQTTRNTHVTAHY